MNEADREHIRRLTVGLATSKYDGKASEADMDAHALDMEAVFWALHKTGLSVNSPATVRVFRMIEKRERVRGIRDARNVLAHLEAAPILVFTELMNNPHLVDMMETGRPLKEIFAFLNMPYSSRRFPLEAIYNDNTSIDGTVPMMFVPEPILGEILRSDDYEERLQRAQALIWTLSPIAGHVLNNARKLPDFIGWLANRSWEIAHLYEVFGETGRFFFPDKAKDNPAADLLELYLLQGSAFDRSLRGIKLMRAVEIFRSCQAEVQARNGSNIAGPGEWIPEGWPLSFTVRSDFYPETKITLVKTPADLSRVGAEFGNCLPSFAEEFKKRELKELKTVFGTAEAAGKDRFVFSFIIRRKTDRLNGLGAVYRYGNAGAGPKQSLLLKLVYRKLAALDFAREANGFCSVDIKEEQNTHLSGSFLGSATGRTLADAMASIFAEVSDRIAREVADGVHRIFEPRITPPVTTSQQEPDTPQELTVEAIERAYNAAWPGPREEQPRVAALPSGRVGAARHSQPLSWDLADGRRGVVYFRRVWENECRPVIFATRDHPESSDE